MRLIDTRAGHEYLKSNGPSGAVANSPVLLPTADTYAILPRAMIVNTIVKIATVSTMPKAPK